jgi:hypothetical protein
MHHKTFALALIAGIATCIFGGRVSDAQQQPIKRTDLLKTYLPEMEGKEVQVWVADIPPGAATGPHFHPTPRFVSKARLFWNLMGIHRRRLG